MRTLDTYIGSVIILLLFSLEREPHRDLHLSRRKCKYILIGRGDKATAFHWRQLELLRPTRAHGGKSRGGFVNREELVVDRSNILAVEDVEGVEVDLQAI